MEQPTKEYPFGAVTEATHLSSLSAHLTIRRHSPTLRKFNKIFDIVSCIKESNHPIMRLCSLVSSLPFNQRKQNTAAKILTEHLCVLLEIPPFCILRAFKQRRTKISSLFKCTSLSVLCQKRCMIRVITSYFLEKKTDRRIFQISHQDQSKVRKNRIVKSN